MASYSPRQGERALVDQLKERERQCRTPVREMSWAMRKNPMVTLLSMASPVLDERDNKSVRTAGIPLILAVMSFSGLRQQGWVCTPSSTVMARLAFLSYSTEFPGTPVNRLRPTGRLVTACWISESWRGFRHYNGEVQSGNPSASVLPFCFAESATSALVRAELVHVNPGRCQGVRFRRLCLCMFHRNEKDMHS